MGILQNFNLFAVGVVFAAIGILGFVVFFNDRKSATSRTFLLFTLAAICWNAVNFLAYQFDDLNIVLWCLRLVLFFAVWYSFFLLRLFLVLPNSVALMPKFYRRVALPLTIMTSAIALSPLTIQAVYKLPTSLEGPDDVLGPGMALFGLTVFALIVGGIATLIEKMKRARVQERRPYWYIVFGAGTTFACYLVFNFVFPVFLKNVQFIPYGAFYTFPFIALTSYAIVRHKVFDVKVISTEILVFILAVGALFELILSRGVATLVFRFGIFLLVLSVGILLIRSVIREVKQREQLQVLSAKLGEANEQLKALDQARAEFISIASHQLRTPPATIKWYLAAVLAGDFGSLPADIKTALKKTEVTNNSLISLIDDMLNASRIERGTMEFLFEPTDVQALTELTVNQLQPLAEMKNLKLLLEKPATPLPRTVADKEKIRQVINNLIDNAIKYSKTGSIFVKLSLNGDSITVAVTDSGKGIKSEELESIFEKYGRGQDSKKYAAGLGLGLYVAKLIVTQHKGRIWAESKGEGMGATFFVSLPVHANLSESSEVDLAKITA